MHYKNGREAKNGDKVILLPSYGAPVAGILFHVDDVKAAFPDKPSTPATG